MEIIKSAGKRVQFGALGVAANVKKGLHEAMVGFINACAYDPVLSSSFADLSAAVTSGVVTAEDLALGQLFLSASLSVTAYRLLLCRAAGCFCAHVRSVWYRCVERSKLMFLKCMDM